MFWHLVEQKDLYAAYPLEHNDLFFYGPAFCLIIAPFSILPDVIGLPLWGIFNALILFYAVNQLKLKPELKIWLMVLSTIELANSVWSNQFNPCVTAMIMLSFTSVENKKDFQAPFWILLGTFTKIYGIAGMIFFLFSKNKGKFVAGCFVWSAVFFIFPMLLSSPRFIVQTYVEWYHRLIYKNAYLINSTTADQSVMGLVRKVSGHLELSNFWFLAVGLLMLLLPLIRFKQYGSKHFRTLVLASLLMFVVLFSTASEHPTFVICVAGLFLWMVLQARIFSVRNSILIFFVLILTGLAPTYLFSEGTALFVLAYALKALPCVVVWVLLVKDLFTIDFNKENDANLFITVPQPPAFDSAVKPLHP